MRIHTDVEQGRARILDAARQANVSIEHLAFHHSRSRGYAFEVALSGSSPYAGASTKVEWPYKAATWDEWGKFLYALFESDPHMIAGPYKGRNDFIDQTQQAVEANERYENITGRKRAGHTGPWLTD